MNISDIFRDVHTQSTLEDLIPMNAEWYYKFNGDKLSFEEWSKAIEGYGYDLSKFHVHPDGNVMNTFFYVGEYGTVKFPTIKVDWLSEQMNIDFQKHDEFMQMLFEREDYDSYFFPEINSMPIGYFIKHYDKISKDKVFDAFVSLYTFLEYGFTVFPKEMVDEILSLAPRGETIEEIFDRYPPTDGKLTVYRGVTDVSTPLEKSISWTADFDTAFFFATRFKSAGKVYSANVPVEKIIHVIDDRNEKEVWVRYEDLENVQEAKRR